MTENEYNPWAPTPRNEVVATFLLGLCRFGRGFPPEVKGMTALEVLNKRYESKGTPEEDKWDKLTDEVFSRLP